MQMTAAQSEARRTCALISCTATAAMTTTTGRRESRAVNGGHPGRHGTSQQASSSSGRTAGAALDQARGLGPGPCLTPGTVPYRPPRWVVIVLCTDRRGGAVLRDQCVHACMHACISGEPGQGRPLASGHAHLT